MGRSLREIANQGDQNKLGALFQAGRLGTALALIPRFYKGAVASHVMTLPQNARAVAILRAFATAGTLTGNMAPITTGAPTTGQVGITATGNIIFATADAVTAAEVTYVSAEGDVIEEIVPVVSHVGAPSSSRGAVILLEAEALTGTSVGVKTVDFRGAAIAAGEAGINVLGTGITFATADAVTRARIKYVATPGVGNGTKAAIGTNLDDTSWQF